MHIAIDASRTTVVRITGTERYALELIRALIRHNTAHTLTLYFRGEPMPDLFPDSPNVQHKVIPFRRAWTHIRFATAIWQDRPDITFVPAHTLPFVFPGRSAVTIHDLGYKHFPEAHTGSSRFYLNLTTTYSAHRADVVLVDSYATRDDLIRYHGITKNKLHVVYPGVEPPTYQEADVRAKYNLPDRYFLFIGTLQPRKNIARLVQAYTSYRQQVPNPAGLVLAGGKGWLYDKRWVDGVEGIVFPGYIDEADKGNLLIQAIALVFPSLYEGFGFPVIEAMHCGTPVVASNTSSLPELVGDNGLLVDPLEVEQIRDAMIRVDDDKSFREQLAQSGRERASQFTWDNAAKGTLRALTSGSSL